MKIIIPATVEPITLAMARKQCKVDAEGSPPAHEDDDLIALYLSAAREWCEAYMGRIVAPTLVEIALDEFPKNFRTRPNGWLPGQVFADFTGVSLLRSTQIVLEQGPVLGVQSITYVNEFGMDMVVDPGIYMLDTEDQIAAIVLHSGASWPEAKALPNSIRVRYVLGYSLPGDSPQEAPLPKSIQIAILLLLAHLYRNREATIDANLMMVPMGVTAFLSPLKLRSGFA